MTKQLSDDLSQIEENMPQINDEPNNESMTLEDIQKITANKNDKCFNKTSDDYIMVKKDEIFEKKFNEGIKKIFSFQKLDDEDNHFSTIFNQSSPQDTSQNNNFLGKKLFSDSSERNYGQKEYGKKKNKKIFYIIKVNEVYRLDYYKKKFIGAFLNFLFHYLKKLLSKCKSEKSMEFKIKKPSYEKYTKIPTEKKCKDFIKEAIGNVFTIKNLNCADENRESLPPELYELKNFLKNSIEDAIIMYYESEEFKKFKNDRTIKKYDEKYKLEKKFSLLEKNGPIKLTNLPLYTTKKRRPNGSD